MASSLCLSVSALTAGKGLKTSGSADRVLALCEGPVCRGLEGWDQQLAPSSLGLLASPLWALFAQYKRP